MQASTSRSPTCSGSPFCGGVTRLTKPYLIDLLLGTVVNAGCGDGRRDSTAVAKKLHRRSFGLASLTRQRLCDKASSAND